MIKANMNRKLIVGVLAMLILGVGTLIMNVFLVSGDNVGYNVSKSVIKSEFVNGIDGKIFFPVGIDDDSFVEFSDLNFSDKSGVLDLGDLEKYKVSFKLDVDNVGNIKSDDENHLYFVSGNYSSVAFDKNYLEFVCFNDSLILFDRHIGLSHLKAPRKEHNEVVVEYSVNNVNSSLSLSMRINDREFKRTVQGEEYVNSLNQNNFYLSVTRTTSAEIILEELDLLY